MARSRKAAAIRDTARAQQESGLTWDAFSELSPAERQQMTAAARESRHTSWGAEADARWNIFRTAVQNGLPADQAAALAGLPAADEAR